MVRRASGDRAVDRLGGAFVVQRVEPSFGRAGEELAARDSQSLRRMVDAVKRVVRKRDRRLHPPSITRSYPFGAPSRRPPPHCLARARQPRRLRRTSSPGRVVQASVGAGGEEQREGPAGHRPDPRRLAGRGPGRRQPRRRPGHDTSADRHRPRAARVVRLRRGTEGLKRRLDPADRPRPRARTARRLREGVPRCHPRALRRFHRGPALPADGRQPARRHDHDRPRRRPDRQGQGRRRRRPAEHRLTVPESRRTGRRPTPSATRQRRAVAPTRLRRRRTGSARHDADPRAALTPPAPQPQRRVHPGLGQRPQPGDAAHRRRPGRRQSRHRARQRPQGRPLRRAAVPLPRRPRRDPRRPGDRVDRLGGRGPPAPCS